VVCGPDATWLAGRSIQYTSEETILKTADQSTGFDLHLPCILAALLVLLTRTDETWHLEQSTQRVSTVTSLFGSNMSTVKMHIFQQKVMVTIETVL